MLGIIVIDLVVGAVLVGLWYLFYARTNRKRAAQVQRWIEAAFAGHGQVVGVHWTTASCFHVRLRLSSNLFQRAGISVQLFPRELPLHWLLMRLRKRQVETVSLDEPIENEEGLPEPREFADWSENPEQVLLSDEMRRAMDQAIATLSETLKSVFVLRDVNGLSTAQTAEVLGLSEEAVKSRLLRARLALRERLAAYFAERLPASSDRARGSRR